MIAATTSVPVTVLIVVAITGGLANIAAAVAGIVNTWVNERRYEDQHRHEAAVRLAQHEETMASLDEVRQQVGMAARKIAP